jgi:hypothetical protein
VVQKLDLRWLYLIQGYNIKSLDTVVLALTSNLSTSDYKVFVSNLDLESGQLPVDSAIRVDKPFSVLQSKILKVQAKIGNVLNLWNRKIMDKNIGVRLPQWY